MLQVIVQSGIPLPAKIGKREKKLCYKDLPFDKMEVNDSFALPLDIGQGVGTAIGSYRYSSRENTKKQFVTRTENGEIRVWRVE